MNCYGACTTPYLFRIVNAYGTTAEQDGGGFWSREFYIDAVTSSTTSSTTSTSSTMSTSSTLTTTNSLSSAVSSATGASSVTATPVSTSSGGGGGNNNGNNNNSTAIGVGVGVGVGVALLLLGGFFLWRHYRNKSNNQGPSHSQAQHPYTGGEMNWQPQSLPMASESKMSGMQSSELPAWQPAPHELAAQQH